MQRLSFIRTYFNLHRNLYQTHNYRQGLSTRSLHSCRKCNTTLSHGDILCFFCKTCQFPVESRQLKELGPFDVFGIPKVYTVDKAKLNQQYKLYQFALHPDKHASRSEEELEIITSNSSIINGHYRTLLDDKTRAKLLFCMKYGEERFKNEVDKSDPDMLADIMDVHENVQALQHAEDAARMRAEFQEVIAKTVEELGKAFDSDDAKTIMTHFKTLSFYMQLLEEINEFAVKD